MDSTLGLVEHLVGDVPVVAVSGELDLASAPELREVLDRHLDSATSLIVADLGAVTFLDSTALAVLVGALKRCRGVDGDLRLVITDPRILKLFTITGLHETFSISPSVDAALRSGATGDAPSEEGPT
jgi:anti-sigma B factor antagonist